MSSTLSWRPAFPPKSGSLPSELKFALRTMNCYKCDCIIVDAVSDTIPLCQTCYQKLTPGELVIITPINCTECGKDVSNPSERVPGKVEPMCRHCFNRGFLPLSTTQPSPIPDFCAQPEDGLVFWDFFVRDNPQMTDVEGNNFTRIVKGLVELIIGVVCMLTAFVLWDIDEGMNA